MKGLFVKLLSHWRVAASVERELTTRTSTVRLLSAPRKGVDNVVTTPGKAEHPIFVAAARTKPSQILRGAHTSEEVPNAR